MKDKKMLREKTTELEKKLKEANDQAEKSEIIRAK
jgi:hypothetical protein